MARYSLKPYQSTYVDPRSVKINEQLRQQFETAFNADDALAGAVDEMDAASFAGDQALKKELEDSTRQTLEERASRGDYETMGMDVAKSARSFAKDYAPLKQNYDMQQQYQTRVKEAYTKGDIDAETYRRVMSKSTHDYEGLQRNEDGSIDESSMFSGYNFVNDVNIDALMSEYMKDYAANKGGTIIEEVGQYKRDAKGNVIEDPEGTQYKIKRGDKYEYISEEEVARAYNQVTSRPEVQAYLQQKADLRTFDLTDEDLQANLMYDLDGDVEDPDNDGGLRGALEEAIEKGKTKEAEALQKLIEQKEGLLEGTGVDSPEEAAELRRQNARQEVMQGELGRAQGAAMDKFGYQNVWSEYAEDYDKKWLQDRKAALDAKANFIPDLLTKTSMTQINNPGGSNISDINSYIADQDASLAAEVQELNNNLNGTNYTAEDILNGTVTPEVLENLGIAPDILEGSQRRIRQIQGEKAIQEQLLRKAREVVNPQEVYDTFLAENIGDYSGADILNEARKQTGNPNLTVEDLANIVKMTGSGKIQAEIASATAQTHGFIGKGKTLEEAKEIFIRNYGDKYPNAEELFDSRMLTLSLQNLPGGNDTKFYRKILGVFREANGKVNDWLEENARITAGGYASTVMPGYDPAAAQKNTKAIKAAFEKQPLDKHFEIFYDGQKQDGTGNVAGLIEDLGWDGEDVIVENVKFHTSAFLGEPSLEFRVKGKKGDDDAYETIVVPYSNLKNSGLDNYFNDPSYQMHQEVNRARNSGLDATEIRFSGGGVFKFEGLKGDNTTIIYTDADGNDQKITPESTMKDKQGNTVKILDYMIQDAAASGQTFYTNFEQ